MQFIRNLVIPLLVLIMTFYVFYNIRGQKHTLPTVVNTVSVYFVKADKIGKITLVPVLRKVNPKEKTLNIAITELLKKPSLEEKKAGYFTEIPPNTHLLGIEESAGKIVINLSRDFESGGGSTSMGMRLNQLIYTTLDSVKKKAVYLELDGKKVEYIGGEGVEVPQPLSK